MSNPRYLPKQSLTLFALWLVAQLTTACAGASVGGSAAAGGGIGTGGRIGTGGMMGTGGSANTGGVTGAGGSSSTGGAPGAGGTSSGSGGAGSGGLGVGGTTSSGGSTGGGGKGGATATGGAGGARTGGAIGSGGGGVVDAGVGNDVGAGSGGQSGLPAGLTGLFPGPGSTGICFDPPLRLTFPAPPTLGTSGKIQVANASGAVVASVDMAATTIMETVNGASIVELRPVYVDANDVVVYLKSKALSYGQTYSVTVDAGAIRPSGGASFSIAGNTTWRFTTAAAAPSNLSALTVDLLGKGQFCSVQGALDALPTTNASGARVTIAKGTYHEILGMKSKTNVTLHGEDRKATIIASTNNNTQQGTNASTSNRGLITFSNTAGLTIENLTIHNLTPQGGSQAEALTLQSCDKCVIRDADILSLQDTLLWSGKVYATNSLIVGNVDYIWGSGVAYFDKCEIRTVGRSGVVVQSRNAVGAYGYVFVDSKFTADSAATSNAFARIDVSGYPGSHVAVINCQLTNISAAAWTITGGSATSSLRFWEYQSTDAAGKAVSTSGRASGSTQIGLTDATSMRNPSVVLGGWQPPI